MNNLDFTSLEGKKIIVGGPKGKLKVKLVGFEDGLDKFGKPNYKFIFNLEDYEGADPIKYCTGFVNSVISSIAKQFGSELGAQVDAVEVLTKAANKGLYIWIREDKKVYFLEPSEDTTVQAEEAPTF